MLDLAILALCFVAGLCVALAFVAPFASRVDLTEEATDPGLGQP